MLASNAGGMRGGNIFGKSKATLFNKETAVPVRFDDVAGLPEAKQVAIRNKNRCFDDDDFIFLHAGD